MRPKIDLGKLTAEKTWYKVLAGMKDYSSRSYLSVGEVASYLGVDVRDVHRLARSDCLKSYKSTSGQYRFDLAEVKKVKSCSGIMPNGSKSKVRGETVLEVGETNQRIFNGDSRSMSGVEDESVNLAITSPPYFNTKMYSEKGKKDLGNIHNLEEWLVEIQKVWGEVFRTLQPGRKFFLNIMNLPVRNKNSFKTLNLTGKSIDICEEIGFIFKRDIIWQKTNGVRAHFGTYPYPGGILINNMHEFILEFEKPAKSGKSKYSHLSKRNKEKSKLEKEFWLSLKNSDVWLMKPEKSGNNRKHVAPFPLELPKRLVKAYSFVGETVLDPFCGSGTTLLAAACEGRNGVGYELNKSFVQYSTRQLKAENGRLL